LRLRLDGRDPVGGTDLSFGRATNTATAKKIDALVVRDPK